MTITQKGLCLFVHSMVVFANAIAQNRLIALAMDGWSLSASNNDTDT